MQIDQWMMAKAIFSGFAAVFLNPRIMLPFIVFLVVIFFMKKGFKILEARIKNRKFKTKNYLDYHSRSCPKCHTGHLVERRGKFGKFLGCSNFPKCSHTESF